VGSFCLPLVFSEVAGLLAVFFLIRSPTIFLATLLTLILFCSAFSLGITLRLEQVGQSNPLPAKRTGLESFCSQ
jgi:hypothetical protein